MKETPLPGRVYQAVPGFEDHLERELGAAFERWGPLYYAAKEPETPVFWQRNAWIRPFLLEFNSISEAARYLRGIQRNWAPVLHTQFRRGALIDSLMPPVSRKPRSFPWLLPDAPLGAWTLLDAHTLAGSAFCSSPFPAGFIQFEEDKEGPPSRAYLKLWESLVRCRRWPGPGQRCLDAGASPGGWTWALARLGARVTAVDRAEPDPRVLAMTGPDGLPLVRFIKHDAFTLDPAEFGPADWVFCDVACYPPRLYEWVERLFAAGICGKFVCTLKMQGMPDRDTARRFAEIPGSQVLHLCHNKHELTWIKPE
ncbi:MAG: SAM-dependent methyltransferase [Treponema sp.]|nr:SAM-dependent methyltransferase [Treponema sp.]